ncbi:CNNM domain-containing protein [Candidatus Berkiella aquae]|uniref:Hemolysin C n=1 Tax=Candidatus Berkiella aquae TaxID=295108 RepID=A0A0Q9YWD5_9GAMM|nr:hemolysin family protein [Candidatus Berkiella aquae]MCS5711716.1 hemolysin family protein [Candidatus Berkiella aquae]
MTTIIFILLSLFFVLLNGFFVAAEFSIVKMRHTRVEALQHTRGLRGKILAKVHSRLDTYLSACQLGITLASLGLGWIGEPAFASLLHPVFELLNIQSEQTIQFISFLFAFSVISYLHIVVGELMPKSMAIRQTEFISLWTAIPLYSFYWVMYPAISVLNVSSNVLLRLFRLDEVHHENQAYSPDEIKLILRASHRYGQFTKTELDLLTKSLVFTDLEISDVMRPLHEIVVLDVSMTISEAIKKINQQRYSRYPVYKGEPSNIIGMIHIKDLFSISHTQYHNTTLARFIRPHLKVLESDPVLEVFHLFRKGKPRFAIVFAGKRAIGFLTLDDLLQSIIGEIKDEFHITQEDWIKLDDGTYIIKGSASVFTLETLLGIELTQVQSNTVTGLILDKYQSFPNEGDKIEFERFSLEIIKIKGSRILQVRVYPRID